MKKLALLLFVAGCASQPPKSDAYRQLDEHCRCTNIHQEDADKQVKIYTIECDKEAKEVFKLMIKSK